jgi:flagellar FliL protein
MRDSLAQGTQIVSETPEATPAAAEGAVKKGKTKLLMIVGLSVLLLGGGAGGFFFWKSKQSTATAANKKEKKEEMKAPLQFLALDPAFVVNFEATQAVRFLQIEVRIASRDLPTIEMLKHNEPLVRNDLLMLFGNQDYQQVGTRQGKEQLRAQTLAAVRKIVQSEGGAAAKVEGVYFTSFVMQ